MTVTETPPAEVTTPSEPEPAVDRVIPSGGLAGVLGSGDHKVIGRLYIGFSLLFGLASLGAALVVSIDRVDGKMGNTILTPNTWNQVLTFQSTALVFLFLLPLLVGVAMCVVPLQVGSGSIAFPRAAAASFWAWLLGSALFSIAYIVNGGPGGGSFDGVGLWAASFAMVAAALILAAVCLATTVIGLRAPGMSLDRVPMFSWSILASAAIWILSLPVLIATLGLIYVDHRYGQKTFGFNSTEMFTRVSWALRQPELYAFAAPILGFVADVVPASARLRLRHREAVMAAAASFAVLGFGGFLQTTITPKASLGPVAWGMAFLAIVPVLVVLGASADTLRSGKVRFSNPLLFAVASLLTIALAVLAGAADSIQRFNLQGTQFDLAHANIVEFAAVTAALGGVSWWASKITGRSLPAGAGLLAATLLLLGTLLSSVPYAISGAFGSGTHSVNGIEGLNGIAVVGYGLVLLGVLVVVLGLLGSLRADKAADDPWGGQTLEWTTASPPTADNFAATPAVASAEPLLDMQEASA